MATAGAPAHWQPIGELVAEFRSECSEFEHLVQNLFDQLDQLRGELDRKARELDCERQRVLQREQQLAEQRQETNRFAHQFEHQEAKLSEALTELDELKNLIRQAAEEAQRCRSESHTDQHSEAWDQERHALQQQLATAHNELTQHATLARELAAARKENAELQANLVRAEQGGSIVVEDPSRAAEWGQERAALESELEVVRGRAAELYESLAQERKSLAEHRAETATELKQLRRIVEKQAEMLSTERPAAPAPTAPAREAAVSEEQPDTPADPVIGSVMAQFAKLQKEVAERRKHRKS